MRNKNASFLPRKKKERANLSEATPKELDHKEVQVCAFCLKENLPGEDKDTNEWIVYVLPLNIFKQTYLFENY